MQQFLLFVLAERSSHPHMAHDSAGYARREAIRRRVTARAVLLEHSLTIILLRSSLLPNRIFVWLGLWPTALLRGNRNCGNHSHYESHHYEMLCVHCCLPFHAGNKKR